jgi:hypothetical protein
MPSWRGRAEEYSDRMLGRFNGNITIFIESILSEVNLA